MKPICSAATVRELDRRTIEDLGMPSLALMEAAVAVLAHALADAAPERLTRSVCVACGPGNNGGDGWALARWLRGWGVDVRVWPVLEPASPDGRTMAAMARRLGIPEVSGPEGDCVIDAVFGTGLARPLEGALADAVATFAGRDVVAVDLPSGLDADTGRWLGPPYAADLTLTLSCHKPGLFAGAGPTATGEVRLVDIGLGVVIRPDDAMAWLVEPADLHWPTRRSTDHKGRSGHLLVVAGSVAMAGAAVLVCEGALAAGAGLVTLAVPAEVIPRLGRLPPEVMVLTKDVTQLDPSRWDAVIAGPGLGGGLPLGPTPSETLTRWWAEAPVPLIYDADALPCSAPDPAPSPRVLTPHPGEAGRLLGIAASEVEADRFGAAAWLARRGTALLKGPYTIVAGSTVSVNPTGGPALATGGSGDVLAGVVGALLARGLDGTEAARSAAWVHGAAGDRLWARRKAGWRASDIAHAVAEVSGALAEDPSVP